MWSVKMLKQKDGIEKLFRVVRIVKAVTTLAVVAIPVATMVGVLAGYGVYSLLRRVGGTK